MPRQLPGRHSPTRSCRRAGKDAAPSPASNELDVVRDWRESLVLQRVRLLTEAEPVLLSLPLALREQLPSTSRVLASLNRLTELENVDAGLSAGDRLKLDRLAASRADIVAISARIKDLDAQIPALLKALGCTLTAIHGIGVVTAMTLLTEIGDPHRFSTEGRFARWCGVAPVAMSSGEGDGPPRNHRLDLGGNRRANSVLHIVHVTQARCHPEAQAYMTRRAAENKSKRAARRAHNDSSPTSSSDVCGTTPTTSPAPTPPPRARPLDKRASSQPSRPCVTGPRSPRDRAPRQPASRWRSS